jgi:hypothetical protein
MVKKTGFAGKKHKSSGEKAVFNSNNQLIFVSARVNTNILVS